MKEKLLALCYELLIAIDARPFGPPLVQDINKSDREAVVDCAIRVIKYGKP